MSQDLKMEKKLPIVLRNEFWTQLIKSVEDEIIFMRDSIEEKKYIYSIDNSNSEDLYSLAEIMFGNSYNAFLSLEKSLKNKYELSEEEIIVLLRRELKKRPYQILYKGDQKLYKTFFNTFGVSFSFQLSIYSTIISFYDEVTGNQRINRNINPLLNVNNLNSVLGIQEGDKNYLGITPLSTNPTLDHVNNYILDSEEGSQEVTTLDKQEYDIVSGTKHIAFETVIDDKFLKEGSYTLYPYEILLYIKQTIKQYKRATEVPHIGAQLTIKINNTGIWNDSTGTQIYTEPKINLKSASNSAYITEGITEISYLEFGYGKQTLPAYEDPSYSFPTELANSLAKIEPLGIEKSSNDDYLTAISEYVGQFFNKISLHDSTGYLLTNTGSGIFDSSNQDFTGFLPEEFLTLKSKSLVFALLKDEDYIDYIEDNGFGLLIGKNNTFKGAINYTTGEYNLSSNFTTFAKEDIPMTDSATSISYSLLNDLSGTFGTVIFNYNHIQYSINLDSSGNLSSNFEFFDESSSIANLTVGSFTFVFTQSILLEDIKFIYQFDQETTFDSTYSLELFRGYTNSLHPITEVGVFGKTNDEEIKMLSYSTFAPIEIYSNEFHLNFGVILEK